MVVGRELLALLRASGKRSFFVVGIGKNVGKTVTTRAIYEAAGDAALAVGMTSIGRDGEAVDAGDAAPKPRLWLRPGTAIATARSVLPRSPASHIVAVEDLQTAAGPLVLARVLQPAYYELVGPPTASGVRRTVDALLALADVALVDGAVDRVAALAGGDDAVVVACGAAAAETMQEAVDEIRALVERLAVERYREDRDALHVEGALTAAKAAELIAAGEARQVVVRDPTQIALTGKAAVQALRRLQVRCERPLHVVAATVASIGRKCTFEPRAFARAVGDATGLPTFDVYAGTRAA
jgi:hypothetical protein